MLKIENTEVLGWEHAIRGMRNPLNSWGKGDSERKYENVRDSKGCFVIGSNDLGLCGSDCPTLLVEGVRYLQGGHGGQLLLYHAQDCGQRVHAGGFQP